MSFSALWEYILSNDILLYIGIFLDGVCSFFLWKKTKKKSINDSNSHDIVGEDIQALIDYHKTVASKLEEKVKKEVK